MKKWMWFFIWCIACLLIGSALHAETVEEDYQKALMAEKGQGELEKAIDLYEKVIKKYAETEKALAARAQLRIGICQEKLGLKRAREAYARLPERFPDQPRATVAAAKKTRSAQKREEQLEREERDLNVTLAEEWNRREGGWGEATREAERMHLETAALHLGTATQEIWETASRGTGQFDSYAFTPPRIPYAFRSVATVPMKWKFKLDFAQGKPGRNNQYAQGDFDDDAWTEIGIGQAWEDQGFRNYNGGGWYRTEIEIDAGDEGRPIYMAFGGVDEHGYVYINGKPVGEHHLWDRPFILDITEGVKRGEKNTVSIYVYDTMGMGGIYGLVEIHQAIEGEDVSRFITNKGGSVEGRSRLNFVGRLFDSRSRKRYERYAYQAPSIRYPYDTVAEVPMKWKFQLDFGTTPQGQDPEYGKKDYNAGHWSEILIGEAWEDQGYEQYDEAAWYRTEVEVKADKEKPVFMSFGGVDKDAWIYVNGKLVGEHHIWNRPFTVDISKAVEYSGKNSIAIRVYDGAGMGGIYGLINIHQPKMADKID